MEINFSHEPEAKLAESAKGTQLPNRIQAGGADASVSTDHGHSEKNGSGRDHSVRHVRNLGTGHRPHRLNNGGAEYCFGEDVFGVVQRPNQFIVRRGRQSIFLDQIDHLS